ncbi:MAG: hypothetical protein RIM80_14485, partial [Alphaproteobacteria bacterium]
MAAPGEETAEREAAAGAASKASAAGHRQRLRKRFIDGGPTAVADYELLELILFLAIPRQDTKPLAKALIERFGGFAEAVSASPTALAQVKGMGEAAIVALKTVAAGAERLAREEAS